MKDIIQKKLDKYQISNEQDEENAIKEITQEMALYALAKNGFFKHASFQGGTCLRIVHGLDRFSEDLDFSLNSVDLRFDMGPYLEKTAELMKIYGYEIEVSGQSITDSNVKKRFLKDESIKKIITFKHLSNTRKKIKVKVELDVNPPDGATQEIHFLDFPTDYSIDTHDTSTLFAGKIHSLLCRPFVKGRDWYDFSWYISQRTSANSLFLKSALKQHGPWKDQNINIDHEWLINTLTDRIKSIDWADTIADIAPFLKQEKSMEIKDLWSKEFFLAKLKKLAHP